MEHFLRDYLRGDYFTQGLPADGYVAAFFDLNGDGKDEAIVYLPGPDWWSSTLVLTLERSSYKIVGDIRRTETPVRVLSRSSHGWRHLAAHVRRAGGPEAYEVELQFNGKHYPIYATAPSVSPLQGEVAGEIVIPSSAVNDAKPLFKEDP